MKTGALISLYVFVCLEEMVQRILRGSLTVSRLGVLRDRSIAHNDFPQLLLKLLTVLHVIFSV